MNFYLIYILSFWQILIKANQTKKIIHFIPHTHDDVGWIVTFEEYYYGIKQDGVQYILDNVISQLLESPERKFIYVEIAFFELWWSEQDPKMRLSVKNLIRENQLEFINSGWTMNDEATCYYEDIIDQMTIGNEFVFKEFGIIPRIGWQIDTFGHSNTMAKIFYDLGFDAIFFARIDDQDREQRKINKSLEFIWMPKTSSGESKPIFTYITQKNYGSPSEFEFGDRDSLDPIIDNLKMKKYYNVDKKAEKLDLYFQESMSYYREKGMFFQLFGNDFNYRNAKMDFKNIEKLMSFTNKNSTFNKSYIFSTPSSYVDSVFKIKDKLLLPEVYTDFFPYGTGPGAYWTGYYTSRPIFKGQVREASKFLQISRTLFILLEMDKTNKFNFKSMQDKIQNLEKQLAICQHHDSITGTSKQYVSDDYTNRLVSSLYEVSNEFEKILDQISTLQTIDTNFKVCFQTERNCRISEEFHEEYVVALYANSEGLHEIEIIVPKIPIKVFEEGKNSKEIESIIICANSTNPNSCNLHFLVKFPSMGIYYFRLTRSNESISNIAKEVKIENLNTQLFSITKLLSLHISYDFQQILLKHCKEQEKCERKRFKITYEYYQAEGSNSTQSSNNYIFRPDNITKSKPLIYSQTSKIKIFQSKLITQISFYSKDVQSNLLFFRDFNEKSINFKIQTFLSPVNISDGIGKEIILKIKDLHVNNNEVFYTDANGLEFQKRKLNNRSTWKVNLTDFVPGNYYPVTSAIFLKDEIKCLFLVMFTDRSQGGASLSQGTLELMIHRRLTFNDGTAGNEALNETDINGVGIKFMTQHWILSTYDQNEIRRKQFMLDNQPIIAISKHNEFKIKDILNLPFYTKRYYRKNIFGDILLRLQNLEENNSKFIQIPIKHTQTILSGIKTKFESDKNRIQWINDKKKYSLGNKSEDYYELKPLEILTFRILQEY